MNEYRVDLRVILPVGLNKNQIINHLSSAMKHSNLSWWIGDADIVNLGECEDKGPDCE